MNIFPYTFIWILLIQILTFGNENHMTNGLHCWHCHTADGSIEKHVCDQNQDGSSMECVEPDQRCMILRKPPAFGSTVVKKCEFPPAGAIIGSCAPTPSDGSECYCKTDNCNKDHIDGVGARLLKETSTSARVNVLSWLLEICFAISSAACMICRV